MMKSAPTFPPGPAAPLGYSSTADSTAWGISASCANWCHGVLSLKFPLTHSCNPRETAGAPVLPDSLKKAACWAWPTPLFSAPQSCTHAKQWISFPNSWFASHAPKKENNRYWNADMSKDSSGFHLEVIFSLAGGPDTPVSPFQFWWNSPDAIFVPFSIRK